MSSTSDHQLRQAGVQADDRPADRRGGQARDRLGFPPRRGGAGRDPRARPGPRPAEDDRADERRGATGARGAAAGDHRRGEGDPRPHAARARVGHHGPRDHAGRRRGAAPGARRAAAGRDPEACPSGRVAAHLRRGGLRPQPRGGRSHPPQQQEFPKQPAQIGSRALKPVRDLFGWVGDTLDAKDENARLKRELERLRSEVARSQTARRDARELRGLVRLQRQDGFPQGTRPVTARVIARSPTVWFSSVKIDKGSNDGVRVDQPVIAAGGLAGKVTSVSGGSAQVTLLTDASSAVSAQVMPEGANGIVKPEVGNPRDLLLDFVEKGRRVTEGTTVVTSGFTSSRVESLFPRGIPIGTVTEVDLDEIELYQRVHIRPFADLRRLDWLQVLTARGQPAETAGVLAP